MSLHRNPEAGLSLTELLVSLVILSAIGVASLSLLQTLARTDAQTSQRAAGIDQADRAMALIRATLLNAVPGTITLEDNVLAFAVAPETGVETIAFFVAEGALWRRLTNGEAVLEQPLVREVPLTEWGWEWQLKADLGLASLGFTLPFGDSGERLFAVPGDGS